MKLLFDENLSPKLPGLLALIQRHEDAILAFAASPEAVLILT